jgi:transcriptional regulator with XRE-family HTH domain
MAGKRAVKVLLSSEQHKILKRLAERLGISESEALRTAFMEYAKSLNLINEHIHQPSPNRKS